MGKAGQKAKAKANAKAKKTKSRESAARKDRQKKRAAKAATSQGTNGKRIEATSSQENANSAEKLLQALGKLPEFEALLGRAGLKAALGAAKETETATDGRNGVAEERADDDDDDDDEDDVEEEEEEEEEEGQEQDEQDEGEEQEQEVEDVLLLRNQEEVADHEEDTDDEQGIDGENDKEDEIEDEHDEDDEDDEHADDHQVEDKNHKACDNEHEGSEAGTGPALASLASLNLPITPMRTNNSVSAEASGDDENEDDGEDEDLESLPAGGRKWSKLAKRCRNHKKYPQLFTFDTDSQWVTPRECGEWCKDLPHSIAIDCEMCGGKDPVTGQIDSKVLCRFSVVSGDGGKDVLIDTLVQPHMPVQDYRTDIHGITKAQLEKVPFTLRHAQAAMRSICCDKTVVVGHALHNDLVSLRVAHDRVVDTALLFQLKNAKDSTPALRDISHAVIKQDMPEPHDSIVDARAALIGAEFLLNVENFSEACTIERAPVSASRLKRRRRDGQSPTSKKRRPNDPSALLVHRIPKTCEKRHLMKMFVRYTKVKPASIEDIAFNSAGQGKTFVTFASAEEANRTFDSLKGDVVKDSTGRDQKRIYLASGGYIQIRK